MTARYITSEQLAHQISLTAEQQQFEILISNQLTQKQWADWDEFIPSGNLMLQHAYLSSIASTLFHDKSIQFVQVLKGKKLVGAFPVQLIWAESSNLEGNTEKKNSLVQNTIRKILVGDGPLLGACKQLVSAMNIPNIEFKGALMHKDVKALFSTTSIFVQHSMQAANGDMEGTPVSVMEASAAGIPVVSTDHAGIPYVVEHGKTGYIVKEGDISTMAQYIHELLVSKEKRASFASAAKSKMAGSCTPEQYEQRFLKTVFDDN